jgi:phosphatidylinositol alpha-1,6-mannosyltransferase
MSGRVLLVANNFPPVRGGSAVVYDNLARAAGDRIDVLAPRIAYSEGVPLIGWREHDRFVPYRVHRRRLLRTVLQAALPPSLGRRVGLVLSDLKIRAEVVTTIFRLIRQRGYAAICLGELLASGWMIRLLRRLLGVRVIVYVHGEEITTRDSYDPQRRRCRKGLERADGVVVVSSFTEAAVRAFLGNRAAGKVKLIGNDVDTMRFTPGPKRPDLLARYGLADEFVFVSVRRLLEKKGVDNALRAFATLLRAEETRAGPAARGSRFLVVGSGPYEAALAALAAELGITDHVVFAGTVPEEDLVDFYRLGDVFVMPNRELPNGDTEGFGLVFLEANGCGLPVIAGRDGGSTDAVQDGHNGLVVDGNLVPEITRAMRSLRDDPELRARLRQGGLERAATAGWNRAVEAFLGFCTQETGQGRDRPRRWGSGPAPLVLPDSREEAALARG